MAARADALVTGGDDLLSLAPLRGIALLTPAQATVALGGQRHEGN